ncbi:MULTISPECIES: ribonuclease T [Marinobacter]|uniref:Ribonuclease T n=1 Tax=Marinobacter xiaoshiensis TaxID=3073652 RepID=A0ABU2HGS9_9GAMM|nr:MULTISPECIES: ribonuclease T [unclassified Marinobacter]MBK1874271.1 ribonuclease T [Marinobacter sp. 1-3A]MBK1888313.1 ribonuclease T [Marinobacter sp. DY40_1A1]MDS1310278.1 ribonuclease T [Marinobacter sp. F60267]
MTDENRQLHPMSRRFRGFLPVVVDVETGGFNPDRDALLEIAAVMLTMDEDGRLHRAETHLQQIDPFEGANLEQSALDFTGIDPWNPDREAVPEREGLSEIFRPIRKAVKAHDCKRAVLVGHNATFDHNFVFAAAQRAEINRNPFHPFSTFDTATLAGLAYGHTVLAQACKLAGIPFSNKEAHSAAYDAEKTADLFCGIVNRWLDLGGFPPPFMLDESE